MSEPSVHDQSLAADRAFAGIKILDLGQVYSGPYCTMLMADLGAEVIKIEPHRGESVRRRSDSDGRGTAFALLNGGKRSLRLDLKREEGKQLFLRLVAVADVVIENFGPGAMERLGLEFDVLSKINDRLIYASGKGFASDSPYRSFRAMDLTVQAMTAVMTTTGFPENPPVKAGPAIADFISGIHLMAAVSAALYQRTVTGRGQRIDVAMQDSLIPTLASNLAGYIDSGGQLPERAGNRHGGLAAVPYNVYETSDGWIAILCSSDADWVNVCVACAFDELAADPSLVKIANRAMRIEEIDRAITAWTLDRTTDAAVTTLAAVNVPVAPVLGIRDLLELERNRSNGVIRSVGGDGSLQFGSPLRLSGSPPAPPTPAAALGAHSAEILRECLGLKAAEIAHLLATGII